jgi:Cu+-exporting ATPase
MIIECMKLLGPEEENFEGSHQGSKASSYTDRKLEAAHHCRAGCPAKSETSAGGHSDPEPASPAASAGTGASYTCPTHPAVRQAVPGICPICRMALEPPELIDVQRRFRIRLALSVPFFAQSRNSQTFPF